MAETITKKLEYHNPYALKMKNTGGANAVTSPIASLPYGINGTTIEYLKKDGLAGGGENDVELAINTPERIYINYGKFNSNGTGDASDFSLYTSLESGTGKPRIHGECPVLQLNDAGVKYMTIPSYSPGAGSFTVEILMRLDSVGSAANARILLAEDWNDGNAGYGIVTDADWDRTVFEVEDDSGNRIMANRTIDHTGATWLHLAQVVDRTNKLMSVYENGSLKGVAADISSLVDDITLAGTTTIGKDPDNTSNAAEMDIVYIRIWSDVRTATEISDNMFVVFVSPYGNNLERNYTFEDFDETDFENAQDGTFVGAPTCSNQTHGGIFATALTAAETDGWHHYSWELDNTLGKNLCKAYLYLDGDLFAEIIELFGAPVLVTNTSKYLLHGDGAGAYAEIKCWNEARSQADIKANMFIELDGDETNLNSYYKCDERTGTTLADSSDNSYDGTIDADDAEWVAGCPTAGSGWVDITSDFLPDQGASHFQGSPDTLDLRNRVAVPGKATLVLNNSVTNSASTVGLYSPGHGSIRDGFFHGAGLRFSYTYSGTTRVFWVGRIYDIDPEPEEKGTNYCHIVAYDWIFEASNKNVTGLTVETEKRVDQALETAIEILPIGKRPLSYEFEVGKEVMSYIFDTERDERTKLSGIARRCALTEFGRISMDGGKLVFFNRHHSVTETTVQHDFDDAEPATEFVDTTYPERGLYTRVKVRTHPRKIDADKTTILATLNTEISVGAGATEKITFRYRDPDTAARISSKDLHDDFPEESVDYVAKANEDGTGSDLSSDLTVLKVVESANSIELSIYNSGSQTAYTGGEAGTFQVRGQGMYRFDPAWSEAVASQDLLDKYGDRELEYDIPYGDNPLVGDSYADYILEIVSTPRLDIGGVNFYPEATADLAAAFMDINMGERITCARTTLGLDSDFFIVRLGVEMIGKRLFVSYYVEEAGSSAYCVLDDNTYAELNAEVCRVAF